MPLVALFQRVARARPSGSIVRALALSALLAGAFPGALPRALYAGVPAPSGPAMLARIEGGQWEVRDRSSPDDRALLCIADGRGLIQLRHQGQACRSFIVEDTPRRVTVHYACAGEGYGQTTVRFETSRVVRLDAQGIAGGLPFAFSADARRIGECERPKPRPRHSIAKRHRAR